MAFSPVKTVVKAMERIAPLRLAEKWDNVGLLLEAPFVREKANRVLLTIDLTTAVAEEALRTPTCCIVSYHPTIFKPLSSFTLSNPLQASLLKCAAAGISVYSPHSALDSVKGGINDWLASAFGNSSTVSYVGDELEGGLGGQGRLVTLSKPLSMEDVQAAIKKHLKLKHIQIAYRSGSSVEDTKKPSVRTISICAGAGSMMLLDTPADVYFTGEMSHHEVLAAVAGGHHVVLCGHTNTERGYLPTLAQKLKHEFIQEASSQSDAAHGTFLQNMEIIVSDADKHPLEIV